MKNKQRDRWVKAAKNTGNAHLGLTSLSFQFPSIIEADTQKWNRMENRHKNLKESI